MRIQKPEVLAPAGSREALQAAIGAGADAVYFGLTDYNARIRARNFELGDLPDLLKDLRRWGIRSYLTFNTLVFSEEMTAARDALSAIAMAGPDGMIVQDLGVVRWIREVAPGLPIHASTQMTLSSAGGIRLVERLGVARVILARELTLPEIARIRRETSMELEVFVHGALCVSYSGQCLSSEAWGGRSANRGQCAQACRLPYDLMVDGVAREMGDRAYLLSPRDLEGYKRIPELTALGISAFKIEGRMKSPEYVAAATALYRESVDRAWARIVQTPSDDEGTAEGARGTRKRHSGQADPVLETLAQEARQVFSRGASEGFLGGVNHQVLVDGRTRSHRGLPAGHVVAVETGRHGDPNAILLEVPDTGPRIHPEPGDGVLLAVSALEEDEVGGRISAVEPTPHPRRLLLRFPRESMPDLSRVGPGTPVFRTGDPALMERLHRRALHPEQGARVPLAFRAEGILGEPLLVEVADAQGRQVVVRSHVALQSAVKSAVDRGQLVAQLGRLGETRYRLDSLELKIQGSLFLPVAELNRMRREAVEAMEELRGKARPGVPASHGGDDGLPESGWEGPTPLSPVIWAVERAETEAEGSPQAWTGAASAQTAEAAGSDAFEDCFLVLCRDREQVQGALDAGARRIVLDFLDLVGLKEASVELYKRGRRRTLALPRVQKPGEERIEPFFLGLRPEEILVRSLGSLERLGRLRDGAGRASAAARPAADGEGVPGTFPILVGDVSLNGVNPDSIEILLGLGLNRLSPGLDLTGEQLERLVEHCDPSRIEVPLHHHLPVFHTEHCVFAAFLSDGADFRTCGRPCDRHRIELKDRTGQSHPVVADVGCRNTVFGARPQSGLPRLADLRRAGVKHYRCEMISQSRAETARVVEIYRSVWEGRRDWRQALGMLQADGRYGVSTGSPEPPRKLPVKPQGVPAKPPGGRVRARGSAPRRKGPTPAPAPPAPLRSGPGSGRARGRGSAGSRG